VLLLLLLQCCCNAAAMLVFPCCCQLYVKTPGATIKTPRVRLADFGRIHLPKGATKTTELVITPKYHSVIMDENQDAFWTPTIKVEKGDFTLHVGGGQPDFTQGVLSDTVTVTEEGRLTTHYRC
jgi:hypothetical protein